MFEPGHLLHSRYQLQSKLGNTAIGHQTWLATDSQSQEQVTVKLLAFNPQMRWEELKLFEREALVLQTLNHPCIPRYRDYFSLDAEAGWGVHWFGLVQDYIPGASLQELLIQEKRFSSKQVKQFAQEILEILIYLHQLSPPVLHRDLKPSNLILGENERIYVVDFGAVQAQAAVTGVTFTVVGTSGYAPLEQFWGRAVAASDLYALGATLIHLLTGIAPADLPQKDSRIQFRDRISGDFAFIAWIETMTETALEKRFSSASQALIALESGAVNPNSQSQNHSLGKIAKPWNTRLKVHKHPNQLNIYIPSRNTGQGRKFRLGCFNLISTTSGFFLFLSFLGILTASFPGFGLFVCFFMLGSFLKYADEKTLLRFDEKTFEIKKRAFGINWSRQLGENRHIAGIFLRSEQRYLWEETQVMIRTHDKTYRLGGALTEEECAWLAQEIQDWLNYR